LEVSWLFSDRHGDEVIAILRDVDQHEHEKRVEVKRANAEKRKVATMARQQERRRQQEEERLASKAERDRLWEEKHATMERAREEKRATREWARQEKDTKKHQKENLKPPSKQP